MKNSACYVISRNDGFWYAVVGGRDLGRFQRRGDAEARAHERAEAMGLPGVTVVAPSEPASLAGAGARS
ncbi:hypothetical protein [Caenispirillum salinarum]|uniref:hypothetical protein n=1 Tax=Caenispirillum salinarum TaxID=859058 RepID=UPI00384FE4F5